MKSSHSRWNISQVNCSTTQSPDAVAGFDPPLLAVGREPGRGQTSDDAMLETGVRAVVGEQGHDPAEPCTPAKPRIALE